MSGASNYRHSVRDDSRRLIARAGTVDPRGALRRVYSLKEPLLDLLNENPDGGAAKEFSKWVADVRRLAKNGQPPAREWSAATRTRFAQVVADQREDFKQRAVYHIGLDEIVGDLDVDVNSLIPRSDPSFSPRLDVDHSHLANYHDHRIPAHGFDFNAPIHTPAFAPTTHLHPPQSYLAPAHHDISPTPSPLHWSQWPNLTPIPSPNFAAHVPNAHLACDPAQGDFHFDHFLLDGPQHPHQHTQRALAKAHRRISRRTAHRYGTTSEDFYEGRSFA
ncbi:hypothetical protein JCM10213_007596 [Rhodosporidiobolus nylandii]